MRYYQSTNVPSGLIIITIICIVYQLWRSILGHDLEYVKLLLIKSMITVTKSFIIDHVDCVLRYS